MSTPARPAQTVCQTTVYCRLEGDVEFRVDRSKTGSVFVTVGEVGELQLLITDAAAAEHLLRAAEYVAGLFRPLPAPADVPALSVLRGGQP